MTEFFIRVSFSLFLSLALLIAFSIGIERKDEIKLHIMGRPSVDHLF